MTEQIDPGFLEFIVREYGEDTAEEIKAYGIGSDKRIRDEYNAWVKSREYYEDKIMAVGWIKNEGPTKAPVGKECLFMSLRNHGELFDVFDIGDVWPGIPSANGDAWWYENDCGQGPYWIPLPGDNLVTEKKEQEKEGV